MYKTQKAFTMLELVFVIAVIGILSAIALPKFAANRSDAEIAKAKSTVASIRMGISTMRQNQILQGVFTPITTLTANTGNDAQIFETVLEYPIRSCKDANAQGCWVTNANRTVYTYRMPTSGSVDFNITNNKFICDGTNTNCRKLTD